jgi:short subunit dehydrogenase-like uncharacterized protein
MENPNFDILIFGATSFVGQILTARMLEQTHESTSTLNWGIAGRSESKLNELKNSLGKDASELNIVIADASDKEALLNLCNQTRVVISTVGPYALYGETLIEACVETGTDYCDLTGEVQWIKAMIDKYEEAAQASGARIVNCCGFDSLPSDMGVYFLQQQAKASLGEHCNNVNMVVKAAKGGLSGGTIASILNITKEAVSNKALRKQLADPYLICPEGHPYTERQHSVMKPEFNADFNSWVGPFIMEGVNTRVVHRSNALSQHAYGKDFRYQESMLTGKNAKGAITSGVMVAGLGMFMLGAALPPTRWALERFVLPKPGEGPSPEGQKRGFFDIRFAGKTPNGKSIRAKVTGDQDPGYGSTSKMRAQAGISLAEDIKKADKPGGFWSPASIFDQRFIDRLENHAGLTFSIID